MSEQQFIIRLLVCMLLAVIIGFERQWRHGNMGLRTNVLVALGAFLYVAMSFIMIDANITRVAAQVVTGVGFLGAGVIMRNGSTVKGLNTAATLWCSAAIGTLTGAGLLLEASLGTAAILFANVILRLMIERMNIKGHDSDEYEMTYLFEIGCKKSVEFTVRMDLYELAKEENMGVDSMSSRTINHDETVAIRARLSGTGKEGCHVEKMISCIGQMPDVLSVSWETQKN